MPKYRVDRTEPKLDGEGNIAWDVWAVTDEGLVIPGKHATILTPYAETQAALDGPNTGPKLIELLKANFPDAGWDNENLVEEIANNINATLTDENLDAFIESANPPDGYPIEFEAE